MHHRPTPRTAACALALASLVGASAPSQGQTWNEPLRPQFHFTAPKGWLNDPNGLVYYDGEYHLFYQHNPNGTTWQQKLSWGHAVSPDLIHWEHLSIAIGPEAGTSCGAWSGSAVVDWNDSAGLEKGPHKTIVLIWTAMGDPRCGQNIAYSNDRGRTFTKYAGNPVIPAEGDARDPFVFWHAPSKRWSMTYWVGKGFTFFSSPDLKHWTREGKVDGFYECPNLFALPIDGDAARTRWLLHGADGRYQLGAFDGKSWTKESGPFPLDLGRTFYAGQVWHDLPGADGRRINITWMREGKYPGMPFNQQMTIPTVVTLRSTPDGPRAFRWPVEAIETLRIPGMSRTWKDVPLSPGTNPLTGVSGELFDVDAEIALGAATEVGLRLRKDNVVSYTIADRTLRTAVPTTGATSTTASAKLAPDARNHIRLRVLLDRTSIEVFANGGEVSLTNSFVPGPDTSLELYARGGDATIVSMTAYPLRSIWSQAALDEAWRRARQADGGVAAGDGSDGSPAGPGDGRDADAAAPSDGLAPLRDAEPARPDARAGSEATATPLPAPGGAANASPTTATPASPRRAGGCSVGGARSFGWPAWLVGAAAVTDALRRRRRRPR